jgi:hypothetical protein
MFRAIVRCLALRKAVSMQFESPSITSCTYLLEFVPARLKLASTREVNQKQEIVCPHKYMVVRRQTDGVHNSKVMEYDGKLT